MGRHVCVWGCCDGWWCWPHIWTPYKSILHRSGTEKPNRENVSQLLCDGSFQWPAWQDLELPGKRVSKRDCLDYIDLWTCLWEISLKWVNMDGKAHPDCGWHHFMCWSWNGWTVERELSIYTVPLCFPTLDWMLSTPTSSASLALLPWCTVTPALSHNKPFPPWVVLVRYFVVATYKITKTACHSLVLTHEASMLTHIERLETGPTIGSRLMIKPDVVIEYQCQKQRNTMPFPGKSAQSVSPANASNFLRKTDRHFKV